MSPLLSTLETLEIEPLEVLVELPRPRLRKSCLARIRPRMSLTA